MALKYINLPTGSVKYWSKQHHRTNKQWPELGRLKAIRCINTCQLQPNWRGYLQLHDEMLTNGMYKTDHNHHIDAFCVLLTTALLWIPQHIIWKHQRGTQVFSKTKSFLLMTDSKSGQTHNQYRIKQPITNLYTSLLLQKYIITETKVQGASLYFRTGVRLTMHVTGLYYALWDEEFFMEFTIHGLLGLHACWWIISESILLATTIQSILQHILKRIPLLIFYTRDYVRDHKTTKKKKRKHEQCFTIPIFHICSSKLKSHTRTSSYDCRN